MMASGAAMAHGSSVAVLGVRAEVRPSALIRLDAGNAVVVYAGRTRPAVSLEAPAAAGSTKPGEHNRVTVNVDF